MKATARFSGPNEFDSGTTWFESIWKIGVNGGSKVEAIEQEWVAVGPTLEECDEVVENENSMDCPIDLGALSGSEKMIGMMHSS